MCGGKSKWGLKSEWLNEKKIPKIRGKGLKNVQKNTQKKQNAKIQEKSCCNLKNEFFWIDKTKQGDKIITIEKK